MHNVAFSNTMCLRNLNLAFVCVSLTSQLFPVTLLTRSDNVLARAGSVQAAAGHGWDHEEVENCSLPDGSVNRAENNGLVFMHTLKVRQGQ